jgi:hypothetical protein
MRIRKPATFAAMLFVGFLALPESLPAARAAPLPTGSHLLHANDQDVILVRGGWGGRGMKGRKMGRGGFYAPGRYSNRGRHLGWQRGRHLGWYKQGRGW